MGIIKSGCYVIRGLFLKNLYVVLCAGQNIEPLKLAAEMLDLNESAGSV